MAFTTDQLARLTRDASPKPQSGQTTSKPQSSQTTSRPQSGQTTAWLQRLLDADLAAVHLFSRSAQSTFGRLLAIAISKLGNGWIYPILAPLVLLGLGRQGAHVIALAGLNAALLHCLYPVVKKRFGRRRPFRADPRLPSLLKTLDEHSFPSGHAMTLTGVLTPIVVAQPEAAASAGALILSMAWSRIATAHHYPSDVVAGAALGALLSWPLSSLVYAVWRA